MRTSSARSRKVAYGHKLNLTTGRSRLILDLVIEAGNPADSERLLPMLERHSALYGEPPRSCLKRAYGLVRCTWRGLGHFRAYVWSAVVAYNLALLTGLKPV